MSDNRDDTCSDSDKPQGELNSINLSINNIFCL